MPNQRTIFGGTPLCWFESAASYRSLMARMTLFLLSKPFRSAQGTRQEIFRRDRDIPIGSNCDVLSMWLDTLGGGSKNSASKINAFKKPIKAFLGNFLVSPLSLEEVRIYQMIVGLNQDALDKIEVIHGHSGGFYFQYRTHEATCLNFSEAWNDQNFPCELEWWVVKKTKIVQWIDLDIICFLLRHLEIWVNK